MVASSRRRALAILAFLALTALSGCASPERAEDAGIDADSPVARDEDVRESRPRVEFAETLPTSGAPLSVVRVTWRLNGAWQEISEAVVHARPAQGPANATDPRNDSFTQTHRTNLSERALGVFAVNVTLPPTGAILVQPRVRADGADVWGNGTVITVRDAPAIGIYLAAWPASARAGEVVNVTWAVVNVNGTEVAHTALHYGNVSRAASDASALNTSAYPEATRYRNDRAPTWFEESVVIGDAGVTFVRAHAIMDRVAYWSPEVAIPVSGFR